MEFLIAAIQWALFPCNKNIVNENDLTPEQLLEELRSLRTYVASLEKARGDPASAQEVPRPVPAGIVRVLEAISDTFVVLDRCWRFVYVNGHALRVAGEPLEELLGQSLWEKYPALLGTSTEAHYRRAMAEQVAVHFEANGVLTGRWLEVHAYPSPEGLTIYSRDVTDRKRAEEALRQSEERHRFIGDLTSDYVYEVHFHPDGRDEFVFASEGFTRLTGYNAADMGPLGGWRALIHPEDLDWISRELPGTLAQGRQMAEVRIRTKDGQTRWIRYSSKPIRDSEQGGVVRLLGAVQDITERKEAEERLREYTRRLQHLSRHLLEVQEQERRHVARELHDEVGQVLTGLSFALDAARRLPAGAVAACLDEVQTLVGDLAAKVRDLSLRLRPSMLDDLGLLPALLWQFERFNAQTRVRVAFEHNGLDQRLPPEVETAAYRIVQEALTNVARHAGVCDCAVRIRLQEGALRLQVEDAGQGFDFESAHRRGESGGLSGMRERAVLAGGWLRVESRPGGGTRVTAEMPAAAADLFTD
jgi:PAS domain S-box-containing protein